MVVPPLLSFQAARPRRRGRRRGASFVCCVGGPATAADADAAWWGVAVGAFDRSRLQPIGRPDDTVPVFVLTED